MPDPIFIALAASLAGITAAVVTAFAALPWKAPHHQRLSIGTLLGVASGFAVGCAVLKVKPDWPIVEDQDRLLGLILPAVLIVESIIAATKMPAWVTWGLRLIIACKMPRALLHGTVYLESPSGDGGLSWSPAVRWTILACLGASLCIAWGLLMRGNHRPSVRLVPLSLGLACCGAGLTIMLSGYASGGQLGPILGGAVIGAVVASLLWASTSHFDGALGFSYVGFFSLLMIGRYFGELTSVNAVLLFLAPLLSVLPLERWLPRLSSWAVVATKVLLVLVPIGMVIGLAGQNFVRNSQPPSENQEGGAADYSDYGS